MSFHIVIFQENMEVLVRLVSLSFYSVDSKQLFFLSFSFLSFLLALSFFSFFFLLFWQFIYLSWLRYSTVCWGFFVILSGYLAVPSSESRSYVIIPWLLILLYRYGCLGYSVVSSSLWIQIFIHKWRHHHPNNLFNCARLSRLSQARLELKLGQLSLTCNNIHVFYFKWWKKWSAGLEFWTCLLIIVH